MKEVFCDAGCRSNPGLISIRITDRKGNILYEKIDFEYGTNNIAEFLACVLALKGFPGCTVYTDSKVAMCWVFKEKIKTNLGNSKMSKALREKIYNAMKWLNLNRNQKNRLVKWDTYLEGEIPADFGRKNKKNKPHRTE